MCLRACNRLSPMSNRKHGQPWCAECREEDYEHSFEDIQLSKDQRRHAAILKIKPATDEEWLAHLDMQSPVVGREFVRYARLILVTPNQQTATIANGESDYEFRDLEPVWPEGQQF
jgi:hypothetical protein